MKKIMLLSFSIVLSGIMLMGCSMNKECGPQKPKDVVLICKDLSILSALAKLNRNKSSMAKEDSEIAKKMLQKYHKPETIELFARLCAEIITPCYNENAAFDLIFEDVFWDCISKLAEIGNDAANNALSSLRKQYCDDAGNSTLFKHILKSHGLKLNQTGQVVRRSVHEIGPERNELKLRSDREQPTQKSTTDEEAGETPNEK